MTRTAMRAEKSTETRTETRAETRKESQMELRKYFGGRQRHPFSRSWDPSTFKKMLGVTPSMRFFG